MPVTDIRVSCGFFDHPKAKRLHHELGPEAIIALQRIWMFAAQYRPKGNLTGLTTVDIQGIAEWSDPRDLVGALVRIGFIEKGRDCLRLHDWSDHNRFAFFGPERIVQSRKAAKTRWQAKRGNPRRRKGSKRDADSNADRNAEGNADRNAERNAPIPTPTPTPVGGGSRGSATPSAPPDGGGRLPPPVVAQPPMTEAEKQRNREGVRRLRETLDGSHA